MPGNGEFGPGPSPQPDDESGGLPPNSASSKVTTSMPSRRNAGDARIFGIQVASQASALTSPPGRPSTHGASWPSSQRFGVMNERFGVVLVAPRSRAS